MTSVGARSGRPAGEQPADLTRLCISWPNTKCFFFHACQNKLTVVTEMLDTQELLILLQNNQMAQFLCEYLIQPDLFAMAINNLTILEKQILYCDNENGAAVWNNRNMSQESSQSEYQVGEIVALESFVFGAPGQQPVPYKTPSRLIWVSKSILCNQSATLQELLHLCSDTQDREFVGPVPIDCPPVLMDACAEYMIRKDQEEEESRQDYDAFAFDLRQERREYELELEKLKQEEKKKLEKWERNNAMYTEREEQIKMENLVRGEDINQGIIEELGYPEPMPQLNTRCQYKTFDCDFLRSGLGNIRIFNRFMAWTPPGDYPARRARREKWAQEQHERMMGQRFYSLFQRLSGWEEEFFQRHKSYYRALLNTSDYLGIKRLNKTITTYIGLQFRKSRNSGVVWRK